MRAHTLAKLFCIATLWGAGTGFCRTLAAEPVVTALNEAIQDEYRAQATYQKVISDFGQVRPFINIVEAETRHISALSALFERRGLKTPTSRWGEHNVPSYESVGAACRDAVHGELENIAMYDRLLKRELPEEVEQTFKYLRAASLDNHLPAFRRCAERR